MKLKNSNISEKAVEFLTDSIERVYPSVDDETREKLERDCLDTLEDLYSNNTHHGKKTESLVGAVIYMCSKKHIPIKPDEISETLGLEEKELFNTIRYFMRNDDVQVNTVTPPSKFVRRFSKELSLDDDVREEAISICEDTERIEAISGRSPSGLAASSIYLASERNGGEITQRELSSVSNKSEVTIRKNYKKQKEFFEQE